MLLHFFNYCSTQQNSLASGFLLFLLLWYLLHTRQALLIVLIRWRDPKYSAIQNRSLHFASRKIVHGSEKLAFLRLSIAYLTRSWKEHLTESRIQSAINWAIRWETTSSVLCPGTWEFRGSIPRPGWGSTASLLFYAKNTSHQEYPCWIWLPCARKELRRCPFYWCGMIVHVHLASGYTATFTRRLLGCLKERRWIRTRCVITANDANFQKF